MPLIRRGHDSTSPELKTRMVRLKPSQPTPTTHQYSMFRLQNALIALTLVRIISSCCLVSMSGPAWRM